jgi:hypothetical protein
MSYAISFIISHLLTLVENELIKEEPVLVRLAVQEIELLISKLENLIASKSPKTANVVNPALTAVGSTAVNMVVAAGEAAVESSAVNS